MTTFADRVTEFNRELEFSGKLPDGIRIMNPFRENKDTLEISDSFYQKYYADNKPRKFIIGINPGRFGAGLTGIPFTDTKRLGSLCGIDAACEPSHEPSSVFVYDMIDSYGGVTDFYNDFYINSVCPLGFIRLNEKGNWVNCNYYDYRELTNAVQDFMITSLRQQIALGLDTDKAYILGRRNAKFIDRINSREKLFGSLVVFDHPRYIEQYRKKQRDEYISEYVRLLRD